MIPRRSTVLVFGEQYVGKSLVTRSIATGRPWLGKEITGGRRGVMVVCWGEGRAGLPGRFKAVKTRTTTFGFLWAPPNNPSGQGGRPRENYGLTMSEMTPFTFPETGQEFRLIDIEGAPWMVARDACDALAINNSSDAIRTLDEDEEGVATVDTPGGPQQMAIVNEAGLYRLIFKFRKPEAKEAGGVPALDNSRQALSTLDDDEKGVTVVDTPGVE